MARTSTVVDNVNLRILAIERELPTQLGNGQNPTTRWQG